MSKEAMKLALEALNTTESDCGSLTWEREQEAIAALREALAEQPAQSSKPWVGLTDDEILYCVELENPIAIAEEVEAKLKEKNT